MNERNSGRNIYFGNLRLEMWSCGLNCFECGVCLECDERENIERKRQREWWRGSDGDHGGERQKERKVFDMKIHQAEYLSQ